jgi:phosphoglycolate phosphatase
MREANSAPARTLMIGDSSVDVQTAINAGIRSCGVTYGFQPETLTDPAPGRLFDRMQDVADWVLEDSLPR